MSDQATPTTVDDVWALFKETDTLIKQIARDNATRSRETERRFRETDVALRRMAGQFTSQWGKMIEALVEPDALRIFRDRGVDVHRTHRRSESQVNGETMEVDLILEDDTEIVVVEVKSTLKVRHVNELLADLDRFTYFFPRYAGQHIYGAVAGLTFAEDADRYAYRQGIYVVSVTGEGLTQIRNDQAFAPRDFGAQPA